MGLTENGLPQYTIAEGDVAWDQIGGHHTDRWKPCASRRRLLWQPRASESHFTRAAIQQLVAARAPTRKLWRVFDINLRQNFYSARGHRGFHWRWRMC